MGSEDRLALFIGAFQSLMLGALMKYFGIVAGMAQAVPFIVGLAFAGFALGARAREKKTPAIADTRFVLSAAALVFLFLSRVYFLNLFRAFFTKEKSLLPLAMFVAAVWLACYLFSYAGYRYAQVLENAKRPVFNYAMLAVGFVAGTALFGLISAVAGPGAALVAGAAFGLVFVSGKKLKAAGVAALVAAVVAGAFVEGLHFKNVAYMWGIKDYRRAADVWSPYYKIDVITFKNGTMACGLYNYTGMLFAAKDFEDMRAAAFYNEELYKRVIPRRAKSALIIGSGGGIWHPALFTRSMKEVTAVEIDPKIVSLMRDKFGAYNRGFYSDRRVKPVVAEGRAFLGRTKEKYDYIEYESLDTRLYASSMNIVPVENTLFTREGLAVAVEHLSPHGVMRISIGTDDDEGVVLPIVSGLPEGVSFDVYRVKINLGKLTGVKSKAAMPGLSGWAGEMPQTAIIVSRDRKRISEIRDWYSSKAAFTSAAHRDKAGGGIKQITLLPKEDRALSDDRPFIGRAGATKTLLTILAIAFVLSSIVFSLKHPAGRMHYFFYFAGAGYAGLEILFIVRGARSSLNPALMSLALACVFLLGNAAACAATSSGKLPGKVLSLLAGGLLAAGCAVSGLLTATPLLSFASSAGVGFLGGLFWPLALAVVPKQARRASLSSDAMGALPGIIIFHASLYIGGFSSASVAVAVLYVAAAFVFAVFGMKKVV